MKREENKTQDYGQIYNPPRNNLSVNSMKLWLKYDTDRSQLLEEPEIIEMIQDVTGVKPNARTLNKLYKNGESEIENNDR
eukprot:UN03842